MKQFLTFLTLLIFGLAGSFYVHAAEDNSGFGASLFGASSASAFDDPETADPLWASSAAKLLSEIETAAGDETSEDESNDLQVEETIKNLEISE